MSAVEIAERQARIVHERRARMPNVTTMLAEVRQYFADATILWAVDGDYKFRARGEEGVTASDSGHYIDEKLRKLYRGAQ